MKEFLNTGAKMIFWFCGAMFFEWLNGFEYAVLILLVIIIVKIENE